MSDMPDSSADSQTPPPIGNSKHADKYIEKLIDLLKWDKATLTHSDLQKYDPGSMQDHYRISLGDYDAEISHSINPNTHQNLYIMLFTNVKQIEAGSSNKAILSYIYLNEGQFGRFKSSAEGYFERKRQEAEEKRFQEAMEPVDEIIDQALNESQKEDLTEEFKSSRPSDTPSSFLN